MLSDIPRLVESPIMQPWFHSDLLDEQADFAETEQLLEVTLILIGSGKQLQYIYYALCNSRCIPCNYHVL